MEIKVGTKVGNADYQFIIDEKNEIDALHKAIVLGNPPNYCQLEDCKNNQFFMFSTNKDKEGNTYINVMCKKCGAKAKLGQYKSSGYFWHKFERFVKEGKTEAKETKQTVSDTKAWDE